MNDKNPNILARIMKSASKIEPHELRSVLVAFVFVFMLMAAYYIVRPVRDAMASDWTDAEVSFLWNLNFFVSVAMVALYGFVVSRVKFKYLVPGVYAFFSLSFFVFYFGVSSLEDRVLVDKTFYVWVSVFSLFHISVFWSFMSDLFTKEQSTRLFAFIAAGASLGATVGSVVAATTADLFFTEHQMVYVTVVESELPSGVVLNEAGDIATVSLHADEPLVTVFSYSDSEVKIESTDFGLVGGVDKGLFEISESGELTVSAEVSAEGGLIAQKDGDGVFEVLISAVDVGGFIETLLLIVSLALVIPIIVVIYLERLKVADLHNEDVHADLSAAKIAGNPFAGFKMFVTNPYLLAIGIFILLYTAIGSFVYFEQKNLLADFSRAERTEILAWVDLCVNILTFGIGMFATSRIVSKFGMATTLALVPVFIVAGLIILAFAPVLMVALALQVARRGGNYAITRPAREMLFTAVDRETRFKAKPVIDIVVYRGGDAVSSIAFAGLTDGVGLGLGAMAAVGAVIASIWAVVGRYLGKMFIEIDKQGDQST
jgi:ATP/ADP translocase